MKKILFITDSYGWKATANGVCVSEVAEYYRDMHYEVHILCYRRKGELKEENINNILIHRIKMNPINSLRAVHEIYECSHLKKELALFLFKWMNRLQSMIFLHWFPMRSPIFTYIYFREIAKLHKQYKYNSVIASYCPFEAAGGTYLFKKKYPNVFVCLYILDSFSNLIPRFFLSKEWQDKKGWNWEQKLYKQYNLILNLQCHDLHYAQERYNVFRSKMKSTDIPHISENLSSNCSVKSDSDRPLTLLYAGLIRKVTGNYAMKLFSSLAKELDFNLEIYTRSDIKTLQNDIDTDLTRMIHWKGFVQREEVLSKEQEADILISMGNPQSDFITSKIFEMMMTGNKILHFYNIDTEAAIQYLKKYPNICFIDVNDSIKINLNKVISFLKTKPIKVEQKWLITTFFKNTPEYTYNLIENFRLGEN